MIRTFLAVFPPAAIRDRVHAAAEAWKGDLPGVRWVRPENLHFTLRFFGDLDEADRGRAARAADRVCSRAAPFAVSLGHVGVFPRWSRPRVLWWGVSRGEERLSALAKLLNTEFEGAGLGSADKPFRAHLTLGRWKDPTGVDSSARGRIFADLPALDFEVDGASLMGSRLGPGGPRYEVLHRAPFKSLR